MALKPLDIYKLLPKKNCKECREPTCLSFAMKLAQGKAEPDSCPYLDEEAKQSLSSQTRAPIQKIVIGKGTRSFTVGEEYVFYRHDKTFFHQPGIIYTISDTSSEEEIRKTIRTVREDILTRIGINLQVDGLAIRADSGSPDRFKEVVTIATEGGDIPLVLITKDPALMEAGLFICGHYNPLIYAATKETADQFCDLAKRYDASLVVTADTLPDIGRLARYCTEKGAKKILLDLSGENCGQFLTRSTITRQLALARTSPELSYPVFLDGGSHTMDYLVTGVVKFASVIVTPPLSQAEMKTALVLRQNIYTDPQKPIQMTPGLYRIGNPGRNSPVFMTVNFSLTFFTLQGYLEATRVPCFLLIVETEGMSVLTSVAAGKLNETVVKEWLDKTALASEVDSKKLIIPGYAAPLSGRIEELTGWKVLVGPRDAADVGKYLLEEWK